tara:strand:+ start:51 stop:1298 length:1248 start_codon:yes stop_codon:yes gene_type:complete
MSKTKLLSKSDRAALAFQNKLRMNLAYHVMRNAVDQDDKNRIMKGFDAELEKLEREYADKNDLFKTAYDKRKTLLSSITSLTDKMETFSEFNYIKEGDKYFKLKHPSPKDYVFLEEKKGGGSSSAGAPRFKKDKDKGTGEFEVASAIRVPMDALKIEIDKDVYDSIVFQREEYKNQIASTREELSKVNEDYAGLLDSWKNNKKDVDTKFQIDTLKEQIANQEVFLRMYQNNRNKFDGVVWNEGARKYMPINYDKHVARSFDSSFRGAADRDAMESFKLDTSYIEDMKVEMENRKKSEYIKKPDVWYGRTIPQMSKGTGPRTYIRRDLSKGPVPDFTSNYISMGLKDGTKITKSMDPNTGIINTKVQDSGIKNPGYDPNSQRAQQFQVKPLLTPKNQNVNPTGLKNINIMKSLMDK